MGQYLLYRPTFIMGIFDGTYRMESSSNLVAAYVSMGIPEEEAKKIFNGEIQMIVKETSPGSFEWKNVTSIPQYNISHSMRIGQELVVTEPFQSRMLFSKANDHTLSIRSEMGGKVILSEMEFNDNGVVINNKIDGGITYSQTFKRTSSYNIFFEMMHDTNFHSAHSCSI